MESDPQECKCGVCDGCLKRQQRGQPADKEEAPIQQGPEGAAAPAAGVAGRRLQFKLSSSSTLSSGSPRTDTPSSSIPVSPPWEDLSSSSSVLTSSDEKRQDLSAATLSSGSMPEISPQDVADLTGVTDPQACPGVSDSTASTGSLEPFSPRTEVSESGTAPARADTQSDLLQATSASASLVGSSVAEDTIGSAPTLAQADMDVDASATTVAPGSLEDQSAIEEASLSTDLSVVSESSSGQSGYPLRDSSDTSSIRENTLADVSDLTWSSGGMEGPSTDEFTSSSPTSSTQKRTRRTVTPRTMTPRAPSPETYL